MAEREIRTRRGVPKRLPTEVPAPPFDSPFHFGVHSDRNYPNRRTMEDAHCFAYEFNDVKGQGFFGVFDGHGGKFAALKCAESFSQIFGKNLNEKEEDDRVTDVLHRSFLEMDTHLTSESGIFSGCTAITAFLSQETVDGKRVTKLYTANVGDARAILYRNGNAIRLSYDHKGTDVYEQKRIRAAGGFVSNGRVNGMLAITRALGDHELKEQIIGDPYTTETVLDDKDTILILACDGVWDVLDELTVCHIADAYNDPQKAALQIAEESIGNGSGDNISVIVVYLSRRDKLLLDAEEKEKT